MERIEVIEVFLNECLACLPSVFHGSHRSKILSGSSNVKKCVFV